MQKRDNTVAKNSKKIYASLNFKGLKRTIAMDTARGILRIKKGKVPFIRNVSFLWMTTLRLTSKDLIFPENL
jgi:hypothetical protein